MGRASRHPFGTANEQPSDSDSPRYASAVRLLVGPQERLAILRLSALILGGGRPAGAASSHRAVLDALRGRDGKREAGNQDPRLPVAE